MLSASDLRTRQQVKTALRAAEAKQALAPIVLDVREQAGFTDYFLICHGSNPRQVQAIADEVERMVGEKFRRQPAHREGYSHAEWIVLDYLQFVVHVFSESGRNFYALERLWQKAPRWAAEGRAAQRPGAAPRRAAKRAR